MTFNLKDKDSGWRVTGYGNGLVEVLVFTRRGGG